MLPLADRFVHVDVLVDDAVQHGQVPSQFDPAPPPPAPTANCSPWPSCGTCSPAQASGPGWLWLRANWADLFPPLPHQREDHRRVRWRWAAFELLRTHLAAQLPADLWQQVDTAAVAVKHPSRVRGPDRWTGPGGLVARFGWDAAHREWCSGFSSWLRTDLGSRPVRGWGIVPAAVDERGVADGLLHRIPPPVGVLLDRGLVGRAWQAGLAERGTQVVMAASRQQRRQLSLAARRPVAALRNRWRPPSGS